MTGLLSKKNKYRTVDGKTYLKYGEYGTQKEARLEAEQLRIAGDLEKFYVEEKDSGVYSLWIH